MKKIARIVLAIVFVFGFILASAPQYALAKSDPLDAGTPVALIAGGAWTSGSAADVAALVGSAPTWLQWLANGVKVTEAGKICHPFRGGQFGWVGIIMQYKNGEWVKLTTTNDWVPNKEGEFMSCAQAPAAGTYALFGYWKRPAGYVEVSSPPINVDCDSLSWDVRLTQNNGKFEFYGTVTGLPNGTQIIMTIDPAKSDPSINGSASTNTIDADGNYDVTSGIDVVFVNNLFVNYTVPTYGCTFAMDHGF